MNKQLVKRGQAFENVFYMQEEKRIMEELKKEITAKNNKQHLARVSGIDDEEVLEMAEKTGITAETFAAIGVVPLLMVAWADNLIEENEKNQLLKAAKLIGLDEQQSTYELFKSWLKRPPGADLYHAWLGYVHVLKQEMSKENFDQFKEKIMVRCYRIAEASGGILGVGSVSKWEKQMLEDLEVDINKA